MTTAESESQAAGPVITRSAEFMRIGILLNSPSAHQVDLLNALAKRPNVDVFVGYVLPGNPRRPWGRPVPELNWEVMPSGPKDYWFGRTGSWLDSKCRDVWIIASNYTELGTHMAVRHLRRKGAIWGYLAEPPNPTSPVKRLLRFCVARSLLRNARGLATTGVKARHCWKGLAPERLRITSIPYYQSLEMFRQLPFVSCPVKGDVIRFVSVAQLIPIKGLFHLLEACSLLPPGRWTLDVYGKGELEQRLLREIQIRDLPVRLCGTVPFDERWRLYCTYHCLVFSSLGDGWGMALPEALAAGLPVISTDMVMSAHEFIREGENGFIGPARDPVYLANAMRHYIERPEDIHAAQNCARASVAEYEPSEGAARLIAFAAGLRTP